MSNHPRFPLDDPPPTTAPVSVSVDGNICQLYGICQQEAPTVFDLAVDGRLRYRPHPEAPDTERVRHAARCCPVQAVTVTERR